MPALFTLSYSLFAQEIIVAIVIIAAVGFALSRLFAKRKSFSTKHACGHDCGCGDARK